MFIPVIHGTAARVSRSWNGVIGRARGFSMPVIVRPSVCSLQDRARVEDAQGVEGVLDGAGDVDDVLAQSQPAADSDGAPPAAGQREKA